MKRVRTMLIVLALLTLAFLVAAWILVTAAQKRAMFAAGTHSDLHGISFLLEQRAATIGTLSNMRNGSVFTTFLGTNCYLNRTNAQGEILDLWNTPYKIEIVGQINFIVRSAGPNKKFGDADDVVFNSISNDFAKP